MVRLHFCVSKKYLFITITTKSNWCLKRIRLQFEKKISAKNAFEKKNII